MSFGVRPGLLLVRQGTADSTSVQKESASDGFGNAGGLGAKIRVSADCLISFDGHNFWTQTAAEGWQDYHAQITSVHLKTAAGTADYDVLITAST